ncbi:MAG: cytochrome P450 [Nitrosomonas sp.]|nr:cytochrome P450 [Nitrosomonas sp.]
MINDKSCKSISELPGPKGIPFLGNLLQIDLKKLHLITEEWSSIYGDIYKFKLAYKTIVAITDSELIKDILKNRPHTYRRVSSIERVGGELESNGVFAAEGKQWERQRHVTMQGFKPEHLRSFFPVMINITERLKNRWRKIANTGQSIDVQKDCTRFTVDITTNFAFGYDINLLEQENDSFQRHLEKFLPVFNRRANAPFPYWHFVKLPSESAMEKSLDIIKKTIDTFIQEARQRLAHQPSMTLKPDNFLEALLLAYDENGNYLSDAEIQGNIITLLLAGEDTTAHTLTWLLYLITEHPEIQHKMQMEADAVLGAETILSNPSVVEKLTYIEAVAHETMRL